MTSRIAMILIVAAALLPGWYVVLLFTPGRRTFSGHWLELLLATVSLGLGLVGWMGLALAELGRFSLALLAVAWLFLSISLGLIAWWRRGKTLPLRPSFSPGFSSSSLLPARLEYPFLACWLLVAIWLFFRPHEFITGGADAGVYVNLGAEIAQRGSILIQDETLAALPLSLYPALLRAVPNNPVAPYYILPAFYVTEARPGEIEPQFYPLHPVWQAIAYTLGGVRAELLLTGLWMLLASLAVYVTVRQIVGWETAALALTGLSLNALQVWFARYPTTEALTQYLFWTGVWSIGAWLGGRQPRPLWALLGGLSLGQVFLVRIDMYFIWGIILPVGGWLYASGRWRKTDWWFFLPLTALTAHSFLHAMWQSRPYFYSIFYYGLRLLQTNWGLLLGVLVLGLVAIWGFGRYRRHLASLRHYRRSMILVAIATVLLLAGYGWFIRPQAGDAARLWNDWYSGQAIANFDHENLIRLGWYLSPLGVWLGVAGMCLLLWQANRRTMVLLALGLLFSLLYLWRIQANPHQVYAMRRYVPVVMPFFVIAAASLLSYLFLQRQRVVTVAALILTLLWLGGIAWLARGFVSQVDYRGIMDQMEQLNSQLAPRSILLFNDPAPIGQGDLLGTPLRFLYGHDVFTVRDPEALNADQFEQLIGQWQAQHRTVYWVEVPDGYDWPAPGRELLDWHSYQIETVVLEGRYDRRPTALVPLGWQGRIMEIR